MGIDKNLVLPFWFMAFVEVLLFCVGVYFIFIGQYIAGILIFILIEIRDLAWYVKLSKINEVKNK